MNRLTVEDDPPSDANASAQFLVALDFCGIRDVAMMFFMCECEFWLV